MKSEGTLLNNILIFLSGLGVFLFAIHMLSSSLEKICGNKMRKKINKLSGNRFAAAGFGFGITTLFQSSTAGVVTIVGFTSAGIIGLSQAIALIIGTNIASVIPNFLISFQVFSVTDFFCAFAIVGAFIVMFTKTPWIKNVANVIIAFSLLFVGLVLMKDATAFLQTNATVISFFSLVTNPVLLLLLGAAVTMLIQSSLGTFAITISLLGTATMAGVIPIESAACIIYGANLGTAITTTIISSISASTTARRAAIFHTIYAIVGCLIFGLLTLTPWIEVCLSWCPEPTFKLAMINLIFNFTVAIIFLPFTNTITRIFSKIPTFNHKQRKPLEVTEFIDSAQAVSIAKATKKTFVFYTELYSLYDAMSNYLLTEDNENYKKISKLFTEYDAYIAKLNTYVSAISSRDNEQLGNKDIDKLLAIIKQMDRVNKNLLKTCKIVQGTDKKITFSIKLNKFLLKIITNTKTMMDLCKPYVQDPDCKFIQGETESSYDKILALSHENSEIKLSAKKFIIENAPKSKAGTEKSTNYIEVVSYLNMISNNISDIVFDLASHLQNIHPKNYEQMMLEGLDAEE